ncbi:MAG TPA: hypothetical protein VIL94_11875 [Acidothermaceae bacterium]|jgi:hypothetical protein
MSSLGLDPEVPLPPVDDDSELVGKNDKLDRPDPGDGDGSADRKVEAAAMPVVGGMAVPIPATAEAVEETDDEE